MIRFGKLDVRWSDTTQASFEKLFSGETRLVAHDQGVGHEDLRAHSSPAENARITAHPNKGVDGWVEDFKRGRYGNAPFEGDYWTLGRPLVAEG